MLLWRQRRAWKRSGLSQTLNATVAKVDNLVWLPPRARKTGGGDPQLTSFVRRPVLTFPVCTGIQFLPKYYLDLQ
jgi:hypothetical protein